MSMLIRISIALLFAICIVGCGSGFHPAPPIVYPDITGNWQIQTGYGAPGNGLLLIGSLSEQDSQLTGTFRFVNLTAGGPCSTSFQGVTLTGSFSETGLITLQSTEFAGGSTIVISLQSYPAANSFAYGSILIAGGDCAYSFSSALGVNIADVTGVYSGTLASVGSLAALESGNLELTLKQATKSAPDGQFALTGSIMFATPSCAASASLSGTVSGLQLNLMSAADPKTNISEVQATATPGTDASQLQNAALTFKTGACAASLSAFSSYLGNLKRQ